MERSSSNKNPLHGSHSADQKLRDSSSLHSGKDDNKKERKPMIIHVHSFLNNFAFQIYFARIAAVAVLFYPIYYSISYQGYWNKNEKNIEIIHEQYYIAISTVMIFASYFWYDYFYTIINNKDIRVNEKDGNITKELDKICQFGTKGTVWNIFGVLYMSISGGLINLVDNLKIYDGDEIKKGWTRQLAIPFVWLFTSSIITFTCLPVIIKSIAAYRNKDFTKYVKKYILPGIAVGIVIQLFCIAAMIFEAQTAIGDPNLQITSHWSSGKTE
jgi:hypothetical protein